MKINIFLSSSSDYLENERNKFRNIISNIQKAFEGRCELSSYLWEYDASAIQKGSVKFQDSINKDLEDADIVVFIFCTRKGEHTNEEWEFVKNKDIRKVVFQKEWYAKLSSLTNAEINEFIKLTDFCKEIKNNGTLLVNIENSEQFEIELTRHLLLTIPHIIKEKEKVKEIEKQDFKNFFEEQFEQWLKNNNKNHLTPAKI